MAIFPPSQTEKIRCLSRSIAIPEGDSQPGSGQVAVALRLAASSFTISFLSSMFTNTDPCPSAWGNSGLPGSGTVATMVFDALSSTEILVLRPLNTQTVFVAGSKGIPAGLVRADIVAWTG